MIKVLLTRTFHLFQQDYFSEFKHGQLFDDFSQAQVTGEFLNCILVKTPSKHVKQIPVLNWKKSHDQISAAPFTMYTSVDFTNMELVRLIFWIFENEFPLPFQLFRCSSLSTNEDLVLFFQRVDMYPNFKYLIVGVNHLPMEVQQV